MIVEVLPVKKLYELPEELADRLDIPEDLLHPASKLTVTAGRRVLVENHRGVLEYGRERILVKLARGRLSVEGSELRLVAMNREELLIAGRVRTVEWE